MDSENLASNFLSILRDGDFLLEISKKQSIDEVREEFSKKGCELTNEQAEFIQEKVKDILSGRVKITEQDLEDISGGKNINVNIEKILIIVMGVALAVSVGALAVSSSKKKENNKFGDNIRRDVREFANDPRVQAFTVAAADMVADANKQSLIARAVNVATFGWLCKPTAAQKLAETYNNIRNR